jgi:hypothetical protein
MPSASIQVDLGRHPLALRVATDEEARDVVEEDEQVTHQIANTSTLTSLESSQHSPSKAR